jgi:lysophospholipase L1-like esterase
VVRYNAAAAAVAGELDIEVNDLFTVVTDAGRDELLMDDGVHFEPPGCELLGQAVAMRVRKAMGQ